MQKLVFMALIVAACGPKEVAFDTLETARAQAKENAEFNAKKWRADTKVHVESNIVSRGDSTQTPECPQGDGWASLDLLDAIGQTTVKLKCSTVSLSVGCLEANDFKSKPYANDDGTCQPVAKVPHPIPKLVK